MIYLRRSQDRGMAKYSWLKSHHTFSFGEYYDETHMGFGPLRVINEDQIQGSQGFDTHGHKDMEIISYIVEGALQHKDSMGNSTTIKRGDVQRMSAGTGVQHSEYNHLKNNNTHFLQIWIRPEKIGVEPSYEQKSFLDDFNKNDFVLVASKFGRHGSISLNQDVDMFILNTQHGGEKNIKINKQRHLWIQIISGEVQVADKVLHAGDGLGLKDVEQVFIQWSKGTELIFFDMI